MLCSLFYCFIYNIHNTYHAFSVVQLTTLCSVSLPLQSIFESDSYLLFSSRVSIFCCTSILVLGLHDFCLLRSIWSQSQMSCTGKQQFFEWFWDVSSLLLFFPLPLPWLHVVFLSFSSFCFPLGLLHLSSPRNPFCKTLPTSICSSSSFSFLMKATSVPNHGLFQSVLFCKWILLLFLGGGEV